MSKTKKKPARISLDDEEVKAVVDCCVSLQDNAEEHTIGGDRATYDFVCDMPDKVERYRNISLKQIEWLGKAWKKTFDERHPILAHIWKKGNIQ